MQEPENSSASQLQLATGRLAQQAAPRTRRGLHPETRLAIIMVLPALLLVGAVFLYPTVMMLVFSIAEIDLATFSVGRLVGLANYAAVLSNPIFLPVTLRTIYFGVMVAVLTTLVAFPIALLLNQRFWGRDVVRVAVLLPWAVPSVVAGVLWMQMFHAEHGFLNGLIRLFGGSGNIIWLGDPTLALHSIIIAEVWRSIPLATLFLLAGLQTLPASVFEAAQIDGAGPWRQLRYVTLPLMLPLFLPILIFQFVWAMKAFDIIFVLTRGGPARGTTTLNYLVYQQGFDQLRFGHAAATAYILCLLTVAIIGVLSYLRWRTNIRMGR